MRNRMRSRLLVGLLMVIGCEIAGSDAEAQSPPTEQDRTRAELQSVLEEYATAKQKYLRLAKTMKTRDERAELRKKLLPPVGDALRFVGWAEQNPQDELALPGLRLIIYHGPFTPAAARAANVLSKNHLDAEGEDFRQLLIALQSTPPPVFEKCLRAYIESSPVRKTRALACWSLALCEAEMLILAERVDGGSPLAELVDQEMLPYLKKLDREKTFLAAEALLKRVISEFKDVELSGPYKGIRLADLAKRDLVRVRQIQTLGIGKTGPEIDGADLFGERMKLSSCRGKVVVLCFWSTSCIPCMKMIPDEHALVAKYREQPFVLLGVNTDQTRAQAKATFAKHKMTWPNWWDGKGTGNPISTEWGVRFLPTIYVLDHKGIIRYKHLRGEPLRKAVDSLLQEMAM